MSSTKTPGRLTIRVSDELQRKLSRAMARSNHLSVSELVREALETYFADSRSVESVLANEINRRFDELAARFDRIELSVDDASLRLVISGLIDHYYLPSAPQDRKLPILALQRHLKGA